MILPSFTITAPTIGLGFVQPSPFWASWIARSIYSWSVIFIPSFLFLFFAWYAKAFRPMQSDSQTSEWYIYFENDVPNTKKACRNICRGGIDLLHMINKWTSDYFLHKKLWNGSPSQSSDTTFIHTKINCTIIFFHPDCTVGPGISPDHASRLAGFTAGRESHPALKISFCSF